MSKEKIIEQAEEYLKAGKLDKAIKEFEKLLANDPNDMRAKLKIGDIYAKKKDIQTAIKIYREVASDYSRDNFHLKAIAVYKNILKLAPTMIEINERLGDLYQKIGLDHDAINQYYIVASYDDSKGLLKEAMEIRKKILQIDPSNTTGRIRLAEMMQVEGKVDEALKEYEKAADILTKKGDREGLIEVYEKMLYFKPENKGMLTKLCKIYFEKREFKKALRRMDAVPTKLKGDLDILELLAEALLEDRQVDASRRKFRDLYVASLEAKETERAARAYSRILREFGDDQDYLNDLAEIQKKTGVTIKTTAPKYREDFEKTDIFDPAKLDELLKKK